MFHFYTPWNLRFSDVFRGYRTTLIENGLSNEWNCLEKASNHVESSPVSIADFSKVKQQSALLFKQIKVALFYHRRLCASNIIMDNKSHAKSLLKTTLQLLQKEDKDLFGKGFPEHYYFIIITFILDLFGKGFPEQYYFIIITFILIQEKGFTESLLN